MSEGTPSPARGVVAVTVDPEGIQRRLSSAAEALRGGRSPIPDRELADRLAEWLETEARLHRARDGRNSREGHTFHALRIADYVLAQVQT